MDHTPLPRIYVPGVGKIITLPCVGVTGMAPDQTKPEASERWNGPYTATVAEDSTVSDGCSAGLNRHAAFAAFDPGQKIKIKAVTEDGSRKEVKAIGLNPDALPTETLRNGGTTQTRQKTTSTDAATDPDTSQE